MHVALNVGTIERLRQKVAHWQEEVRVYGDETELTQEDVDNLRLNIRKLCRRVGQLNEEYRDLLVTGGI